MLASWKKSYDQPRKHIKNQRHYFVNKGPSIQSYNFSSSHVWMWELKLQHFGHRMKRPDSLEKILMMGKIEGRRRKGRQRIRCMDGITDSMEWVWATSGNWWWTGRPSVLQSMGSQSQRLLSDWTELIPHQVSICPDCNHCTPSVRAGDTSKLCSKQVSSSEA